MHLNLEQTTLGSSYSSFCIVLVTTSCILPCNWDCSVFHQRLGKVDQETRSLRSYLWIWELSILPKEGIINNSQSYWDLWEFPTLNRKSWDKIRIDFNAINIALQWCASTAVERIGIRLDDFNTRILIQWFIDFQSILFSIFLHSAHIFCLTSSKTYFHLEYNVKMKHFYGLTLLILIARIHGT